PVPLLAFVQATPPSTPVAGQRNIIDTIPSQPGYSDFWRVYKVLAPEGYVANSIRSLGDAVASGYTIQETNTVVNCPVVYPNATIAGSSQTLVSGWYRHRHVFDFGEGPRSPPAGLV